MGRSAVRWITLFIEVPFCTMHYLILSVKVPFLFISQLRELQHPDFFVILLFCILLFPPPGQFYWRSKLHLRNLRARITTIRPYWRIITNRGTMFNFWKCSCFKKIGGKIQKQCYRASQNVLRLLEIHLKSIESVQSPTWGLDGAQARGS